MFTRKLIVLAVPLALMLAVCLLVPVLSGLGPFFGSVVLGALLGVALALLLPLAGATRLREPFAHLLWIPAAVTLAVLISQYLSSMGVNIPLLRLLSTLDTRIITVESAFAAYMIAFSVRTGRGI
jgi:hypothetical protein